MPLEDEMWCTGHDKALQLSEIIVAAVWNVTMQAFCQGCKQCKRLYLLLITAVADPA